MPTRSRLPWWQVILHRLCSAGDSVPALRTGVCPQSIGPRGPEIQSLQSSPPTVSCNQEAHAGPRPPERSTDMSYGNNGPRPAAGSVGLPPDPGCPSHARSSPATAPPCPPKCAVCACSPFCRHHNFSPFSGCPQWRRGEYNASWRHLHVPSCHHRPQFQEQDTPGTSIVQHSKHSIHALPRLHCTGAIARFGGSRRNRIFHWVPLTMR